MKRLAMFLLGVWEFRRDCTTSAGELIDTYDTGRELAHRVTFRIFDRS